MTERDEMLATARTAVSAGNLGLAFDLATALLTERCDDVDALEVKALVETTRGDGVAAEKTLRQAIAAAPERRWPYGDLARLLIKLDRPDDAEFVARAALQADNGNADAHALLGGLLLDRDFASDAAVHFEAAMAGAGRHPQLVCGLARARMRQGNLQSARLLFEEARSLAPDALEPLVYLAELEERAGFFSEAERMLDQAESVARALGGDVDLQRTVLLERMARYEEARALLVRRSDLSGAALLQRGRLHDRLGDHLHAWVDWKSGKAKIAGRHRREYPAQAVQQQANSLAAFFASGRARGIAPAPRAEGVAQPIFIIGFPRSGTTLTQQILASHSAIAAGGELPFGRELYDLTVGEAGGAGFFPNGLSIQSDWPRRLRDHYLQRAGQYGVIGGDCMFFTDKMPSNDIWLPLLRLAFPDSPVVLVRRHPLDVLTSVMAHDMTHGFNCAYRLEDAARHLALVDRVLSIHSEAGVGPTLEIRYEDLVADTPSETRRLMASVGLPMEPSQLRFHELGNVPATPSYAQVREPINDRSIGRWRNYASELKPIFPIVAEAMQRGGYTG
jgi:tetratricopeptide (TPR) repeat protein